MNALASTWSTRLLSYRSRLSGLCAKPSKRVVLRLAHAGRIASSGAPGMTRTCDLLVRSQTLYPTELGAREVAVVVDQGASRPT
jgi:hypothetical protein